MTTEVIAPAQETAPVPTVAVVETPATIEPPDTRPQVSPTLQQVLEERRQSLIKIAEQGTRPNEQAPLGDAPVIAPVKPNEPEAPKTPDPKEQLYEMFKNDPGRLLAVLQAAAGEQAAPVTDKTDVPAAETPVPLEQLREGLQQEAAQFLTTRPQVTLETILGKEALEELGAQNQDFTPVLEQFIHATIAPAVAGLLSNLYEMQQKLEAQLGEVKPVAQSYQEQQMQRELAEQFVDVFPQLAQDVKAREYADRRFNELAPTFMPEEILKDPSKNKKEYARIAVGIAKLAASEYLALAPANTQTATATPTVAPLPPEPQPVQPQYRNHLGQFQGGQDTAEDYYRARARALRSPR